MFIEFLISKTKKQACPQSFVHRNADLTYDKYFSKGSEYLHYYNTHICDTTFNQIFSWLANALFSTSSFLCVSFPPDLSLNH